MSDVEDGWVSVLAGGSTTGAFIGVGRPRFGKSFMRAIVGVREGARWGEERELYLADV